MTGFIGKAGRAKWGAVHAVRATPSEADVIVLYSYPPLFGAAVNNGYGLKIFAYLRLARLPFAHRHVVDASTAPRGQLPYIVDAGEVIGDSDTIIAHLESRHGVALDAGLTGAQRDTALLVLVQHCRAIHAAMAHLPGRAP